MGEAVVQEELAILYKLKSTNSVDFVQGNASLFERELLIASKIGLLDKTVREEILKQFNFLFK